MNYIQTILIVDDERSVRDLLNMALSEKYAVVEASNGREGLGTFEIHRPDLVITDMQMPGMSGLDFVCALRRISSEVKILVYSSSVNQPSMRANITAAGADLILEKPATLDDIERIVDELLCDNK